MALRTRMKKVVAVMVVVWLPALLSHELRFSDGPGFDAARRAVVC